MLGSPVAAVGGAEVTGVDAVEVGDVFGSAAVLQQ